MLVATLVRITQKQHTALKRCKGLSLSEHIRRAIDQYLGTEVRISGRVTIDPGCIAQGGSEFREQNQASKRKL